MAEQHNDKVRLSENARGHVDKDPHLAMDGEGRLWVAWQSYRHKKDRILARSLQGRRRAKLLEVSDESGANFQPRIACNGNGEVWVVWCAAKQNRWQILARPISSRGTGSVVCLSESSQVQAFPQVTADSGGRIWAAWSALRSGRHQVVGRCLSDGVWSPEQVLSAGAGEHYRPVLCADDTGCWVAWETGRRGLYELHLRHWAPQRLSRPARISLTESWELFPRLCADGQGGVWAAWVATHDVTDGRGFVDHKVEVMAGHLEGKVWTPYRSPDHTKPPGYVTHLYDALLGLRGYMGFVGRRRRPQVVRDAAGDVWVLYERKEEETVNRHGPDALFYARPLTGSGRRRSWQVDEEAHAYTVNGDLPVTADGLPFAGQVPSGRFYGDICTGFLQLDRTRPVCERPASVWKGWRPIRLPGPGTRDRRPSMRVNGKTYRLFWGDPHCHGNLSGDAEGEIDENYAYGRHKSRLDFMAVTDNDVIYDNVLTPAEWALLRGEAGHFDEPGKFVTFSAYERTYRADEVRGPKVDEPTRDGPRRRSNHRIVLFPKDEGPLYRFTERDADTLAKWVAGMEKTDAFVFPHHPEWEAMPCSRLGGAELCSCWDIYILMSDTIPEHLRQGYRLAFMGNSDSHRIVPGMGGALTGVWAEELTRESIFEALRARRCFATNGERTVLDVRVNGVPMGAETMVQGEVTLSCRVRAPRRVARVELFRDGVKILSRSAGSREVTADLHDRPAPGQHFYYVQISLRPLPRRPMRGRCGNLQVARGDLAWSSPIWVTVQQILPAGTCEG